MLEACSRRWFLYNFAKQLEGDFGRDIEIERAVSYWTAFAGQLADDGVTEAIRYFKAHRVWRTDLDLWLKETALEYVHESRAYREAALAGIDLPKRTRQILDRYFFDEVPDKEAHLHVLKTARAAVQNFFSTDIPSRIEVADRSWLMCERAERFPWTVVDGVPVYAVYDFALKTPDMVTIFDWKTGQWTPQKEQRALRQLHWYALYAITEWGYQSEQIRLAPVFLSVNAGYEESPPDCNLLQEIRTEWATRHAEIKALMDRYSRCDELLEHFPMTESLQSCAGCVFRTCSGYARIRQSNALNPVKFAVQGEIA